MTADGTAPDGHALQRGKACRGRLLPWLMMLAAVAAGPGLYVTGLWAASMMDRQPLGTVAWFDPTAASHLTFMRLAAAVATAVGALLTVFGMPWLLGTCVFRRIGIGRIANPSHEKKRATAGAWSLILNTLRLMLVCLVLRHTVGIHRSSFLWAWLAWTVAMLAAAGGANRAAAEIGSLWRRWNAAVLIGMLAMALGTVLFAREQCLQCFNGDGTEAFQLAQSLRFHFLPYWEIDATAEFGTVIVYPALVCSYWNLAMQLLLGNVEIATRISYWAWWLGVFAAALQMIQPRSRRIDWPTAIPLALVGLLTCLWYTFYTGYYPYMADLACLGVPDVLFTLLVLLAMNCLRCRDMAGWVLLATLASLVVYAGPIMLGLTVLAALAWRPVSRPAMLRAAGVGVGLHLAIALLYCLRGWSEGHLEGWRLTLQEESVLLNYFWPVRPSASFAWFAVYFVLGSGGISAVGLLLPFRRPAANGDDGQEIAWERTVATVALAYLLIILGSRYKNLHYLGPLLPIPVMLWLRAVFRTDRRVLRRWAVVATTASILVCLIECWPPSRPTFTLNRDLGAKTTFLTDSYKEACRLSKLIHPLYYRGSIGWEAGPHAWVQYSELSAKPAAWRPFVVTDGPPPAPDYELHFRSPDGINLYCNDRRRALLLQTRPPAGADRFPWILRATAIAPLPQKDFHGGAGGP